jgi:hypothetical protein
MERLKGAENNGVRMGTEGRNEEDIEGKRKENK